MPDPSTPQAPVASDASSDESRSETLALQRAPTTRALAKRALAGAAVAGLTELVLGRRLYYAWEALRHTVTWLSEPAAPEPATNEQQLAPRQPAGLPTLQEAMEGFIQDVLDAGKRAYELGKPAIDRARKRALERLKEPGIGAAVIGGATLGAVASIGVVPALVGVGAAYLAHRKQRTKDRQA